MRNKLLILFTFIYCAILIYIIPVDGVLDRDNYLNMATFGWSEVILLTNYSGGFFSLLFNEPIWLLINSAFSIYFDPESTLLFIIFISSFLSISVFYRKINLNVLYIILIFLLPQVLKNYVIHLRQGLAISIFLIGFYSKNKYVKYIYFAVASLIHSSFFIVLFSYIYSFIKNHQISLLSIRIKTFAWTIISLTIGISILAIAKITGARQGEQYLGFDNTSSGLAFLFWFLVLLIFLTSPNQFKVKNQFSINCIIFYLATYFFTPLTARIFESSLIFVLVSGFELPKTRQVIFVNLILFYCTYQYLSTINQPILGWGV